MRTVRLKWLVLLHVACWTLIPTLTHRNAPLDVIEGFVWGREWLWGTYKHPPLQAWLLEIAYRICGTSGIGYFGLSALCVAIALWAAYKTAILLSDETTAVYATVLTQGILYFTLLSTEFNPNILQLTFWALAAYAFVGAMLRQGTRHWMALAVVFALGFYAKYFMAVCGVSFALYMVVDRKSRRWFIKPQPYLALVACALLYLPHLLWLSQTGDLPFTYAASRFQSLANFYASTRAALVFTGAQFAALLPCLIPALVLLFPFRSRANPHRMLIRWLAFAPLVLIVVPSFLEKKGLPSMWGTPILTFVPLWLVTQFRIDTSRVRAFAVLWCSLFLLILAGFAGYQIFAMELGFKPSRGHFPGREIAQYYSRVWKAAPRGPLKYVVGDDVWLTGNAAFYSPETPRPHVWIYGTILAVPWIDEEKVARDGAIVLWDATESRHPEWVDVFLQRFPRTLMQVEHRFPNGVILGSAVLLPSQ